MLDAAIPVLAVTEITAWFFEYFFLRLEMMARNSNDLPEPSSQSLQRNRMTTRVVSLTYPQGQ